MAAYDLNNNDEDESGSGRKMYVFHNIIFEIFFDKFFMWGKDFPVMTNSFFQSIVSRGKRIFLWRSEGKISM